MGLALILANKIFGQVAVDKAYGGGGVDHWLRAGPPLSKWGPLQAGRAVKGPPTPSTTGA